MEKKTRTFKQRLWTEWIKPILVVIVVCSTFRSAVADWNDVPTGSMNPTILEGDRIVVNKLAYDLKIPFTTWHIAEWNNPKSGEIIVCYSPKDGTRLVKRVIAVPGDTVEMRNNQVFINGKPLAYHQLSSDALAEVDDRFKTGFQLAAEEIGELSHAVMANPGVRAMRSFTPVTVPAGEYFVMGDNRDNSFDSRMFGFVPRDQILGRSSRIAFSLNYDRYYLPRFDRFLKRLQ